MFESTSPLATQIRNDRSPQVDHDTVQNAYVITPSDANDLPYETKAIYCGVDGDVKLITSSGKTITMKNLASGVWHPVEASRIYATGTTATGLLGAW